MLLLRHLLFHLSLSNLVFKNLKLYRFFNFKELEKQLFEELKAKLFQI